MSITVVLINKNNLYHHLIEEGDEISFGTHKKDTIQVPGFNAHQIKVFYKNSRVVLDAKAVYNVYSDKVMMSEFVPLKRPDTYMYFTVTPNTAEKRYKLPYSGHIKVGKKLLNNDIVLRFPFVSDRHFDIRCENGSVRIEDVGSTNGTYLNGRRVDKGALKNNDVISILSINIVVSKGELIFEGVGNDLVIKTEPQPVKEGKPKEDPQILLYHKSPRIQETLPDKPVVLSTPPAKGQKYVRTRGMGSVLAGTGTMAAASMLMGFTSPALLAARAASLISPIISVSSSSKMNKENKKNIDEYTKQRIEKYGDYIEDQRVKILDIAAEQHRIINNENPSPDDLMRSVFNLETRLWERMVTDKDFLSIRLGMGYDELCVPVTSRSQQQGFNMENDEVEDMIDDLIEETRIVDDIPLRLRIADYQTVGFVGERDIVLDLIRNMVISITSVHSFEDVRLVLVYDEEEHEFWKYFKWLPHIWAADGQGRMIATGKDGANDLLDNLIETVEQRKQEIIEAGSKKDSPILPYYVFIFASKKLVEKHYLMNSLFDNDPNIGITSLFLFDDLYELPPKCKYIVDMRNEPCAYEKGRMNERKYFSPDPKVDDERFNSFVRRMSAVELEGFATQSPLPQSITFLEGYGVETVEELNVGMRWQMSDPYSSLAAPIGRLMGDKTFALDIHEHAHGPHGLAAGTTGSGKSELIQTWILSMACCYHPHDVNFVIVDYKGGGMADVLEPLPHVVGKITNISGDINRPIESLRSEVLRRERIFAKYGVSSIYKFQRLHREGKTSEILPHLIIVVDDFAELKKDQPEFIKNLISVSQVGRSLGIHLVLATQKPGGVVDDNIKANSKFRLCLKVQDATDSREMLKTPDASRIREAGRAFIKVGEDEMYALFQSFWSGAPYFGNDKKSHMANQIKLVDLSGQRIDITDRSKNAKSETDEISAIVKHIADYTKSSGIEPVPGPWLEELPKEMSLDDVWAKYRTEIGDWLRIPVGIYDIPSMQQQGCLFVDLSGAGHLAVYGAPGTGKTTFLKTLITSIARTFSPEQVVVYAIDCGGWGLGVFSGLPHVGGVALDCEEEKIMKLKLLLENEIEKRKKLFVSKGVSSLTSYREDVSDDLPAVVLVIDNISVLFELLPDLENFFVMLSSQGATYGIYLVYSNSGTSGVRYKVVQNMKNTITFEMTDKADYAMLVGRPDRPVVLSSRGRALIKGVPPVEFQTALGTSGSSEKIRNENLKSLISEIDLSWKGNRPKPIPVMPEKISSDLMLDLYNEISRIPIGLDVQTVSPVFADLSERYCFLVTGGMNSGKSSMLNNIFNLIRSKFEADFYIFDSDRRILSDIASEVDCYACVSDKETVSSLVEELVRVLNLRMSSDEKRIPIVIIIDDLKQLADGVDDDVCDKLARICRLSKGMDVMLLAAGRSDDITKYSQLELLTSTFLKHQNGISLSGTANHNMFFISDLKSSEKNFEPEKGVGILFDDGKASYIRYFR